MAVAQRLPLMTLCSPAAAEDCSNTGATAGMAEREAPNVGKVDVTIGLKGEQTHRPPSTPRSQGRQPVVLMGWP